MQNISMMNNNEFVQLFHFWSGELLMLKFSLVMNTIISSKVRKILFPEIHFVTKLDPKSESKHMYANIY